MKLVIVTLPVLLLIANAACGQTDQDDVWDITGAGLQLPFHPDGVGASADDDRLVFWHETITQPGPRVGTSPSSTLTIAVVEPKAGKVEFSKDYPHKVRKGAVLDAFIVSGKLVITWTAPVRKLTIHRMPDLKLLHTESNLGAEVFHRNGHLYLDRPGVNDIAVVSLETFEEVLSFPYIARSNDLAFRNTRFGASVGGIVLDDALKPTAAIIRKLRPSGMLPIPDGKSDAGDPIALDARDPRYFRQPAVHYHDGKPDRMVSYPVHNWLGIDARLDPRGSQIVMGLSRLSAPTHRISLHGSLKSFRVERGSHFAMTSQDLVLVRHNEVFTHPIPDLSPATNRPYVVPEHNRVVVNSDDPSLKLRHGIHNSNGKYSLTFAWAGGRLVSDEPEFEWDTTAVKEHCTQVLYEQFKAARARGLDPVLWLFDLKRLQPGQFKVLDIPTTDFAVPIPIVVQLETESGELDRCRYLMLQCLSREELLTGFERLDSEAAEQNRVTNTVSLLKQLQERYTELIKQNNELVRRVRELESVVRENKKQDESN